MPPLTPSSLKRHQTMWTEKDFRSWNEDVYTPGSRGDGADEQTHSADGAMPDSWKVLGYPGELLLDDEPLG